MTSEDREEPAEERGEAQSLTGYCTTGTQRQVETGASRFSGQAAADETKTKKNGGNSHDDF